MDHYTKDQNLRYAFQCRCNGLEHAKQMFSQLDIEQEFPLAKDKLLDNYYAIEKELNENWHPDVTLGAALHGDGLLTDHGVHHIESVMKNSYDILGERIKYLNGYELYLLLISIHFHDLGNIYGREQHEKKISEIIDKLGDRLPLDAVEKMFVFSIATAHGGFCDEDKDTISHIAVDQYCNGIIVRAKALAAILRFADEISDDLNRAAKLGIEVPKENKAFHEYSKSLETPRIDGKTLKFNFRIPYKLTQEKVGKGDNDIFLYDEIILRLEKCMRELEYCRKFSDGFIDITTLNVTIAILKEDSDWRFREKFQFRLSLKGYPKSEYSHLRDYLESNDTAIDVSNTIKYIDGLALKNAMVGGTK